MEQTQRDGYGQRRVAAEVKRRHAVDARRYGVHD